MLLSLMDDALVVLGVAFAVIAVVALVAAARIYFH